VSTAPLAAEHFPDKAVRRASRRVQEQTDPMDLHAQGRPDPSSRGDPGREPVRAIAWTPRRRTRPVPILLVLAVTAMGVVATPAWAQLNDFAGFVQAGEGDRAVKSVAFGATAAFTRSDPSSPSPWSFYGEAVVGQWFARHRDAGQTRSVTQFTFAPVLRYTFGGAFNDVFVEAGIGLSVITPHFEVHGRTFSTTFNFDDHASLGRRFGARRENELSIRIEHFSNGGIKNPNPGQNFAQLRFARHF
jgi:lipid A 3-O-deacylase